MVWFNVNQTLDQPILTDVRWILDFPFWKKYVLDLEELFMAVSLPLERVIYELKSALDWYLSSGNLYSKLYNNWIKTVLYLAD